MSRRLGRLEVVLLFFTLAGALAIWHASPGLVGARASLSVAQLCMILLFIKIAFTSTLGSRGARAIEWAFAALVDLAIPGVVTSLLLR
jgi:hypothetical protein